jgi:hypothetical protein
MDMAISKPERERERERETERDRERPRTDPFLTPLRRNQPCPHLDLGFSGSR